MNEVKKERKITVVATRPELPGSQPGEQLVEVNQLRGNFEDLIRALSEIISVKFPPAGDFELDKVTFQAEITAEGGFRLLGVGAGGATGSGVTLTLRRSKTRVDGFRTEAR